jgi:hypothetical protein
LADEVIIGNVGGESGVASEATLLALVRAIERMGGQKGQRGSGSKVQEMYNKAQQAGTTATTTQTAATTAQTAATNKTTEAASNLAKGFGALAMRGVGQVMASLAGMTRSLLAGEDSMAAYASQVPIVGSLLGAMAGYLDKSVDAFRELSSVGAGFNNDIVAMRRAAAQNGLTLEEFSTLVRNNSQTFAKFGGTVTQGVQRFTAMNNALKDTGTFEQLKGMGFSISEINEGMASYVELQSRLGRLQGKSTQELAAGSASYLKELDMMAKLTGQSRKELMDQRAAQAADASFRALANQFEEGSIQAQNFQRSMDMINKLPKETGDALKDLADGVANTEAAQKLLAQAGPELRDAMMKVGQGADPRILQDALRRTSETLENRFTKGGARDAAFLGALGQVDPVLRGLIDNNRSMLEVSNLNITAAEEEAKKENETTTALTTFQDSIRKLSSAIQTAFIDSGLIELFAIGINRAADLISGMADSIKAFTESVKVDGFLPAVLGLVGDAIKGIFTNGTVVAAMVAGIGALFLAKSVIGALGRGLSGVTDNIASKMMGGFGARAAPTAGANIAGGAAANAAGGAAAGAGNAAVSASQALKSVGAGIQKLLTGVARGFAEFGKTVGEIGKGIGKGLGGILEGLAKGLGAFANPQILIGAGILSGAIVVIGAGIAGATWLVGKALPTFAEGMQKFAELDGNNLIQVGKGIGAISLAMAAMGASSVVSGLGGMLGGLAEGITSLFGGKTPFDKLQEFSQLNIDAARVEANANAVVAYSKAMSSMGSGGATGALGNLVANAVNGLVGFFGGEVKLPYAKMVEFQSYNLDATKMQQNSLAVKAFAEAMSNIPTVNGERTGGLIGAVANFFMGSQQVPWAQAVAFGQLTLPVDKIKTNAEAMAAFGDALSKVPQIDGTRSGGLLEGLRSFFGGSQQMPWDSMRQFGELRIDAQRIKANAEAMAAFGNALNAFKGGGQGTANLSIPPDSVASLGRLATIGSNGGLQQTAAGLQSIANVQNLQTTLTALNGLDATKLSSYNTALRDLTRTLADLNKELANENRGGLFGMGDSKANAGDILKNISVNTSTGAGNTEQLNGTMTRMVELLQQMKEISDKIEKNTKRGTGVDVANRDVTSF